MPGIGPLLFFSASFELTTPRPLLPTGDRTPAVRRRVVRRTALCSLALLFCLADRATGEESLWGEYASAARTADAARDDVTAERAWRAAATIAEEFEDDDPRKGLTFAQWGLALTRTANASQAPAPLKRAETLLAKVDPPPTASEPARRRAPEVIEARGAWAWGTARSSTARFSQDRAAQFAAAVQSLGTAPSSLAPLRLAELFSESAVLHRNCGKVPLAERHAQAAVDTLDQEKFVNATMTEALVVAALTHLEAGRIDLARGAIGRAAELHKGLADLPEDRRPNEAVLQTVALRVALEQRDRASAEEIFRRLGIGSDRELTVGEHPLLSQFDLLATGIEWELASGAEDVGPVLGRLKSLAGSDGHLRGQLLIWQGRTARREDRLREALQNLVEAVGVLDTALGKTHPRLAAPVGEVAVLQAIVGQDKEATASARRAVAIASVSLPAAHPGRGDAMAALARVELLQQHAGEAVRIAGTSFDIAQVAHSPGDPVHDVLRALLADAEAQAGNLETARLHLKALESASFDSLPAFERIFVHWHIGHASHLTGELSAARTHYADAVRCGVRCRPNSPEPHSLAAWPSLCLSAIEQAGSDQAGPNFAATWKLLLRLKGTEDEAALEVTRHANACYSAGRYSEAIWLYDRAIEAYARMSGDHGVTIKALKGYQDQSRKRLKAAKL